MTTAAIVAAPNLGANVGNDGEIVRVTLPELTEERRKEFVKLVRDKGEHAKVAIRNVRRKAKDDLDALTLVPGVGKRTAARLLVDLKARRTIRHADQASRVGWTPFDGFEAKGWPVATIVRGITVMRDDEIVAHGQGKPVRFGETLAF